MFYIHRKSAISAQQTFTQTDLDILHEPQEKQLKAIEPVYDGIPPGVLRRMGKAVRMTVGAALPLIQSNPPFDGILIGTANGGKEDCVKFLNQVIEYNEGLLTPINFVQSTPNAPAAQVALLAGNQGYNITHVHMGLAFEYCMIDVDMLLEENPGNQYLLGGVDDISSYNYSFEEKAGRYKKEIISNKDLYTTNTPGSIIGEAAVMFFVNGARPGAIAKIIAVDTLHTDHESEVKKKLGTFIETHFQGDEKPDLFLSGEDGDNRVQKYYNACESLLEDHTTILRFKHMTGEFPTATAMGTWLCCEILDKQTLPAHMIKRRGTANVFKTILIYNNFRANQHSFIIVTLP